MLFVCDQVDNGVVSLDEEQTDTLMDARSQIESAKAQLQGEDYNRALLYLTLPVSGDETYQFIDTIRETAQKYYPDCDVYVAGDSTNEYDRNAELCVPDRDHFRHDPGCRRYAHRADDFESSDRRYQAEPRPRHDHLHNPRFVPSPQKARSKACALEKEVIT